ncbi:MAG: T9SS type A sorting domain-containing protein [Balneolaceae bacterium]|nr:T9SS type A sorting domain-containing protein [Balneolaceae bacterium]MBO6547778.1 T9SS type A sorting domain-containing protein [Balneolaceae bacterium]MBO6648289.1 T9SS type A sorting domain-containing protein [Balneolaceae bacterium]
MVQELLSRVLLFKQHIAFLLFFLVSSSTVFSQSVLLPADVVIVSVNSAGDSFDFIPLVNLETGTTIWFSNGVWNPVDATIEGAQEVEVTIKSDIDAGTNIHINEIEDPRVEVNGHLSFSGDGDRVFAYQKDEGVSRVIYGIGWGNKDIWNPESEIGSAVPVSISRENHALLHLGLVDNYQYYLRNGASGTPGMLASFVGDPAKWRGRDNRAFPSFGTAFRILKPPVVLFDESISTTTENESIILNVAIFEHDGSRLTVDAVFNEFNSTADTNDVSKFKKHTFNFTGLIGDAVYAVEIPTFDDNIYESTENAFFELQNLTNGELGDFVTHVAFLPDNEIPNVLITGLSYTGNPDSDYIEIQNNERIDADLSGWKLISRDEIIEFPYGTYLSPLQVLRIAHPESDIEQIQAKNWLRRNQGVVELRSPYQQLVSSLDYRISRGEEERITNQEITQSELLPGDLVTAAQLSGLEENISEEAAKEEKKLSGWYTVNGEEIFDDGMNEKEFFVWNEISASFAKYDPLTEDENEQAVLLSYFEQEELNEKTEEIDSTFIDSELELSIEVTDWSITLSGTDLDKNGVINGSEGFNLVMNRSGKELPIKALITNLEESLFEGAIYPYLYLWEQDGQGWMSAERLDEYDVISKEALFWIRADSIFEATEILIQPQLFQEQEQIEEKELLIESELRIGLETTGFSKSVSIQFFEDVNVIKRDIIVPGLESGLRVSRDEYLFFGAGSGLNWNSEINLRGIQNQKMVFPLAFETSESGTFNLSVQKFDGIPGDWIVTLIDELSEKEYELNPNWQFEFEYFKTEESVAETIPGLDQTDDVEPVEKEHRFMLVITPPEAQGVQNLIPEEVSLHQNFPNPFNPATTISFYLPESVPVKLSVFNVVGQPVAVLTEGTLSPGDHEFEWDATGLPSGMYIYQLEVGTKVMTRKMTLVK